MTPESTLSLLTPAGAIQITQTGATLPDNLTYAEWFEQVRAMRLVKHIYHAALADLVKYGRQRFGEKEVEAALTQLHFDLSDVYRANAVIALEDGVRVRADITAEHRYVLGKELADHPEKQEEWAATAAREKLTPAELRISIGRGEVVRGLRNERSPGIVTFEAVQMMFRKAVQQYGGTKKIATLPVDVRAKIRDLLRPVVELVDELAAT